MNLYKSFGSLLETWMTEGVPGSDPREGVGLAGEWPDTDSGNSLTLSESTRRSKSNLGTPLRSESEDSGMEMSSPVGFLPSPGYPAVSADQATAGRGQERTSSSFPPESLVLPLSSSSSSSSVCLSEVLAPAGPKEHAAAAVHLKLEQALQRTDMSRRRGREKDPLFPGNQALWRQCGAAALNESTTGPHALRAGQRSGPHALRGGQRSGSLSPGRRVSLTAVRQPAGETQSLSLDTMPVKSEGEESEVGLSPGLGYLEQVCRMLEKFASLQLQNQRLQMEVEAVREQQAKQQGQESKSQRCVCKADDGNEEVIYPRLETEEFSRHSPGQSDDSYPAFRRRSASDTRILAGHLRKQYMDTRGQYHREDLLEEPEGDETLETKTDTEIKNKSWKLKIASLTRREGTHPTVSDENSQQRHSSVKKAGKLGHLFRRRRKTVPM